MNCPVGRVEVSRRAYCIPAHAEVKRPPLLRRQTKGEVFLVQLKHSWCVVSGRSDTCAPTPALPSRPRFEEGKRGAGAGGRTRGVRTRTSESAGFPSPPQMPWRLGGAVCAGRSAAGIVHLLSGTTSALPCIPASRAAPKRPRPPVSRVTRRSRAVQPKRAAGAPLPSALPGEEPPAFLRRSRPPAVSARGRSAADPPPRPRKGYAVPGPAPAPRRGVNTAASAYRGGRLRGAGGERGSAGRAAADGAGRRSGAARRGAAGNAEVRGGAAAARGGGGREEVALPARPPPPSPSAAAARVGGRGRRWLIPQLGQPLRGGGGWPGSASPAFVALLKPRGNRFSAVSCLAAKRAGPGAWPGMR